jgi:hypothetical protein
MPSFRALTVAAALSITLNSAPLAQAGNVLSTSSLQTCSTTDGLKATFCDTRLSILYSVVSGQDNTDAIRLMVDGVSSSDSSSTTAIGNQELSITLRKTPIYFQYPTTYFKTYNYQAYELVAYGTSTASGTFTYFNDNPFNLQPLNSCVDSDTSTSPSCGYAVDGYVRAFRAMRQGVRCRHYC